MIFALRWLCYFRSSQNVAWMLSGDQFAVIVTGSYRLLSDNESPLAVPISRRWCCLFSLSTCAPRWTLMCLVLMVSVLDPSLCRLCCRL